jgi:hypothetical protein
MGVRVRQTTASGASGASGASSASSSASDCVRCVQCVRLRQTASDCVRPRRRSPHTASPPTPRHSTSRGGGYGRAGGCIIYSVILCTVFLFTCFLVSSHLEPCSLCVHFSPGPYSSCPAPPATPIAVVAFCSAHPKPASRVIHAHHYDFQMWQESQNLHSDFTSMSDYRHLSKMSRNVL